MQNENSSAFDGGNDCKSFSTLTQPEGEGFSPLYSPFFSPNTCPSDCSTEEDVAARNSILTFDNIQPMEFLYPSQSDFDPHDVCLAQLHHTAKEVEELRLENINLRLANRDLNNRLGLMIQASLQKHFVPHDYSAMNVVNGFRRLCIGETSSSSSPPWDEANDKSPTSVIESDCVAKVDVERVSLPKSISVRSSGYLKSSQSCSTGGNRIRSRSPAAGTQKVYVRGGTKEEEAMELEVYSQGMFKTELCNKWQECGACPYGDHCQFAHGIKELRPVIRHPRYKTELCRMVVSGDSCPYGHRCHFRHALTDQEKYSLPLPMKQKHLQAEQPNR